MGFKAAGWDAQSGFTMMKWHTRASTHAIRAESVSPQCDPRYAAGALCINRYRPRSRWGIIWEPLPSPHTLKLCALRKDLASHTSFSASLVFLSFVFPYFILSSLTQHPASLCLLCILSQGHPLAFPHTPILSVFPPSFSLSLPAFLHLSFLPLLPCFFPLLPPPLCCTAVQWQISALVPVRERHGKLHAKTQSANVDKGGGVRTSVHTKHQTHLNHKMKWLTSAELENIFLPSLF